MVMNVIHLEAVDSTSTYARKNAASLSLPALITSGTQTEGRGRQGKSFYSPGGSGLYMSLLFRAAEGFDLITPAAAVCVCKALEEISGKKLDIKWVNDIFLNGKKICGILTERFTCAERELTCVGIGVNLSTTAFPPELSQAGSLGVETDAQSLAEKIAHSLLNVNAGFDRQSVLSEYRQRLFITGKEIEFVQNGVLYNGTAVGITDSCSLIVKTGSGNEITLSSGEISLKSW
jgi:BirA family biotin operon repressor/biotin-[acetyl-CoA-carboxylase] ligase